MAAHVFGDFLKRNTVHLGGSGDVDVDVLVEFLNHLFVAGQHGSQTQLKLAVVGTDEHVALARRKGGADGLPQLGAGRNVLQIGVFRAVPAGGSHVQAKGSVQPAFVVDQLGQGVDVGVFELGVLAVLGN